MKHNVLIIDDNATNRELIVSILSNKKDDYNFFTAEDGIKGCEQAFTCDPDIILMDWEMPGMDGFTAIQKIRSREDSMNVPILMVTAYASTEHLEQAYECGATDYIQKPLNHIELRARVRSAIKLYSSLKIIKEQNEVLEKKARERKKLSLLARETANAFITVKLDGYIEWGNEGFKKIHGYDIEEYKAKFGDNIFTSEHHKYLKEKVLQTIESGDSVSYSVSIKDNQENEKWIHVSVTPTFYNNETIDFIAITETDITEIKIKEEEINKQKRALEVEKQKSDSLLLNILPFEVAKQLKSKGAATPRTYRQVTVLFTDFKDFSKNSLELPPQELVNTLDGYFRIFDEIISRHYLEKIKTVGDAYMAAGGLPLRNRSNPINAVLAGLQIQDYMNSINDEKIVKSQTIWELRLGIHTGPVIAGVVGTRKFAYDIWGKTVNIAARMESSSHVGMINISGSTYEYIKDFFDCTYRGKIEAKNVGKNDMYFVDGLKEKYASDKKKIIPNDEFMRYLNSL